VFRQFGGNHVVPSGEEFAVVSFQIRTSTTATRATPFKEIDQAGGGLGKLVPKGRRSMGRHLEDISESPTIIINLL
jgi:hypothetical protein